MGHALSTNSTPLRTLLVTHGLQKFSENIEYIILSYNHLELKNMPCSVVAEVFCVWFASVITIKGKTMDTTTRGWTQSVVFVFIHVSIHWHCQHWTDISSFWSNRHSPENHSIHTIYMGKVNQSITTVATVLPSSLLTRPPHITG